MRISAAAALILMGPSVSFAASYNVLTIGYSFGPNPATGQAFIETNQRLIMNNLGEVAGTFSAPSSQGNLDHGFRTQPDLPFNPLTDAVGEFGSGVRGPVSFVSDMNNLGELVGASTNGSTDFQSFRTDSSGKINANTQAGAGFINDRGQLAGTSGGVAFRTAPNQPYNPATDNLGNYNIYDLNNTGEIVGDAGTTGSGFRTAPDGPVVVGNLGTHFTGHVLNDLGQVAGVDDAGNVFLTAPDQTAPNGTDFGRLPGGFSFPEDVNNSGVIVGQGSTADPGFTAFVTLNGQVTDLNTLIDPASGLHLTDALQINDNGQILALAQDNSGLGSIVLLTPVGVPEPTSLSLLGASSLLVLRRRRA